MAHAAPFHGSHRVRLEELPLTHPKFASNGEVDVEILSLELIRRDASGIRPGT